MRVRRWLQGGSTFSVKGVDALIAAALALVCAWSQPRCDTARGLDIRSGPTPSNVAALYDSRQRAITVSDQLTQPAVVSALLAHELTHAADGGYRFGGCPAFERRGYEAQAAEATWFVATFGQPVLDEPEDQRAWRDMHLPLWWHVQLSCSFDAAVSSA